MFCPYRWTDGVKSFPESSNIQIGWKYYQVVIHNSYYGGHIETGHHVICFMTEDVEKHFLFSNFSTPVPEMMSKILDNDTTPRDKISFNKLGITKVKSGGASMMLKTGMEVYRCYTVFNHGPPIPHKN